MNEPDAQQTLRSRRLVQISGMVMLALAVAMGAYLIKGQWHVVGTLSVGFAMMGVCQWLNFRGRTGTANRLLLTSLMATVSALMWVAEGLHDVVMLTFPVLLILAGLLVERRFFFALLGFMLSYLVLLTLATELFHWRVDTSMSNGYELLRDSAMILGVSGFAVWVIMNDLHGAMGKLQVQIGRFQESQKQLTYLSQHDNLTGLPNRAMARDRIEQAIVHASRNHLRVALLFVDLDNFKAINDSLGHAVGDDFLRQMATRLGQAVRKSDIVARHGGDEFVIALTDVSDVQDVATAAATVLERLTRPFMVKDTELSGSCSIGIAMYPDDGHDYESLLREADIAMYQAKEAGRNAFRFFDQHMNANQQQNLLLVSSLRTALARREFVLHYQPVVDLATGKLLGAEALVRWLHPEKGLVPPMEFIPAAEKSGLIVELGEWVLGEACRQRMEWQTADYNDFVMAVNLSPVQFRRGNVESVVEDALKRSGLPARCLELEITESTLIQDAETFMISLQKIKAMGVKISIDDFGTGYSNLSYLQKFSVDKLKIDQSFVRCLMEGPQQRAIVNAIIQMAKSLHLQTTAEGIEDDTVRQELLALGCALGQGYHFARPLPAAQFLDFMRRQQTVRLDPLLGTGP
jgi:diguanylate cyclase (GGDEF)-like protein